MEAKTPQFSVSEFVAVTNQTLEYAYPSVVIEGEVESFKVNQGKYVFFNLKDDKASLGCFMMVFNLRVPIEDGMKVVVRARPKLTQWGKFSLTIDTIKPSGEGSLKKSFELLKAKLEKEGLFATERKRPLPEIPQKVGVIASTESAGYGDFMKITHERWGGVEYVVYHTLVQGLDAPDQIIGALQYFNELPELPDVLVIIRGGGSADDLAVFNDEQLIRGIAMSRTPTLVGVGHEVDVTLADLAADVRAATPSNAAQILVPDKKEVLGRINHFSKLLDYKIMASLEQRYNHTQRLVEEIKLQLTRQCEARNDQVRVLHRVLEQVNPRQVLERGYAIIRGKPSVGGVIEIETSSHKMKAKVIEYDEK